MRRVDILGEVVSAVETISTDMFCVEDILLEMKRSSYSSIRIVKAALNSLVRDGRLFSVTESQVGRLGRVKEYWSKTPRPSVTEEEALDKHIESVLPTLEYKFTVGDVLVTAGLSRSYYSRVRLSLNRLSQRGLCHRYLLVDEDDVRPGRPSVQWTAKPEYMELSKSFLSGSK